MLFWLALRFILLTGPEGQVIEVNPDHVVSIRAPRSGEHFSPGTHCILHTTDGKFISVQETCEKVDLLLMED